MKLLLTSGGIRNENLISALFELANEQASNLNIAFIPTAANVEDEDKSWLIDDLTRFKQLGFKKIDIVDIASLEQDQLLPRLEQAQIIVFGGGDTKYLLECIKNKLGNNLLKLLETRVLVGISAGSVMCCPIINPSKSEGLHYVDFLFVPHKGSSFAKRTKEDIEGYAKMMNTKTYWVDDNSAIAVNGNEVNQIGPGVELLEP